MQSEKQKEQKEKLDELLRKADVRQYDCYQCGKCTGGCPMAHAMDLKPRGVMRCTQIGSLERIVKSNTIWLCTGCHTCVERCPHDVNIPNLIEEARYLAAEMGYVRRDSKILNEVFLANIRMFGRNHEMLLAGLYNMLSLKPLQDMPTVPHMLTHKLIGVLPHQTKNTAGINRMIARAEKFSSMRPAGK
ncbi:MAG: 4Fe-4S dicluster domain-containing protein [Clostridiales Family XIII bacterium]|jgi:heterodisulfide reductase subunit C|nr:4Fe-4S dicluster domain-containing protein [Clostridiales Family XIII bacterium]